MGNVLGALGLRCLRFASHVLDLLKKKTDRYLDDGPTDSNGPRRTLLRDRYVPDDVEHVLLEKPKSFYVLVDAGLSYDPEGTPVPRIQLVRGQFYQYIFGRAEDTTNLLIAKFSSSLRVLKNDRKDNINLEETVDLLAVKEDVSRIALYDAFKELLDLIPKGEFRTHRVVIDIFTDGIDNASQISLDDLMTIFKKEILDPRRRYVHVHFYNFLEESPIVEKLLPIADANSRKCRVHPMDKESVPPKPKPKAMPLLPSVGVVARPEVKPPPNKIATQRSDTPLSNLWRNGVRSLFSGPNGIASNLHQYLPQFIPGRSGITFFINNSFENQEKKYRPHSKKDSETICSKFEDLTKRPVYLAQNVKNKEELDDHLNKFKERIKTAGKVDYIVVVISTHGRILEGSEVLMEDGTGVDIYFDILYQLCGANFPLEKPLPIVAFVQACRVKQKKKSLRKDASNSTGNDSDEEEDYIKDDEQIFIASSSAYGEYSHGNEEVGSIFLTALCKILERNKPLIDMLREVDNSVKRFINKTDCETTQSVEIAYRLSFEDPFYF